MKLTNILAFITLSALVGCAGDEGPTADSIGTCKAGHEIRVAVGTVQGYMEFFRDVANQATLGDELSSELDNAIKDQDDKLAQEVLTHYCSKQQGTEEEVRKCKRGIFQGSVQAPQYKAEVFDYAAMRVQHLLETEYDLTTDACVEGWENQKQPDGTSKPVKIECKTTTTETSLKPGYNTAVQLKQDFMTLRDQLRAGKDITKAQAANIEALVAKILTAGKSTYADMACKASDWFSMRNQPSNNIFDNLREFNAPKIDDSREREERNSSQAVSV